MSHASRSTLNSSRRERTSMAVEIIDLTHSPPPPAIEESVDDGVAAVPNDDGEGKDKGKEKSRRKRNRKKNRKEARDNEMLWWHDKHEETNIRGEKRVRNEREEGSSGHGTKRLRSPDFMVDTAPGIVSGNFISNPVSADVDTEPRPVAQTNSLNNGLLLPAHVALVQDESQLVQNDSIPLSPISETSGIDFLDDDRAVGAPRYFDDRPSGEKILEPCKICGDTDHHFKNCNTLICLTCGVRDEHSSRSCPILKCCFNCQEKGHIARNCPNILDRDFRRPDRIDCERCGSWKHHGTNCPTIWRIYNYLTDAERDEILAKRESKRLLGFDNGGEGYIARDSWCYNCGNSGHLGDDCTGTAMEGNSERPDESSAFGSYNQSTGPFASPLYGMSDVQRAQREWESDDRFDDGHGFSSYTNVGRRARESARAKASEEQKRIDDAEELDWFDKNRELPPMKRRRSPLMPSRLQSTPTTPTTPTGPHRSQPTLTIPTGPRKFQSTTIPTGPRQLQSTPSIPIGPSIRLGVHYSKPSQAPSHPDSMSAGSGKSPAPSRPSLRDRIDMSYERDSLLDGDGDLDQGHGEEGNTPLQRNNHGPKRAEEVGRGVDVDRKRENGRRWRGGYER